MWNIHREIKRNYIIHWKAVTSEPVTSEYQWSLGYNGLLFRETLAHAHAKLTHSTHTHITADPSCQYRSQRQDPPASLIMYPFITGLRNMRKSLRLWFPNSPDPFPIEHSCECNEPFAAPPKGSTTNVLVSDSTWHPRRSPVHVLMVLSCLSGTKGQVHLQHCLYVYLGSDDDIGEEKYIDQSSQTFAYGHLMDYRRKARNSKPWYWTLVWVTTWMIDDLLAVYL